MIYVISVIYVSRNNRSYYVVFLVECESNMHRFYLFEKRSADAVFWSLIQRWRKKLHWFPGAVASTEEDWKHKQKRIVRQATRQRRKKAVRLLCIAKRKKKRKKVRKNLWTHCRWRSRNLLCFLGKSFLYTQLKQLAWFWCITLKWFTWLTIHVIHVIYEHYDPGPRRALFLEQYFGILGVVLLFIADVLIG